MSLLDLGAPNAPADTTTAGSPTPPASTPPVGTTPPPAADDNSTVTAVAATRPDYIPEKFWLTDKNEANVAELAKSYTALEQLQGRGKAAWESEFFAGRPEAPEKYEVKEVEGVSADELKAHPIFAPLAKFAHARGASNEQLQEVLGEIAKNVKANVPDPEGEMKKLGENATARTTAVAAWLTPIVSAKPAYAAAASQIATTAEGVEFLEVLMAQAKGVALEKVIEVPRETGDSRADIEALMATEGYFRGTDRKTMDRVAAYFQRGGR